MAKRSVQALVAADSGVRRAERQAPATGPSPKPVVVQDSVLQSILDELSLVPPVKAAKPVTIPVGSMPDFPAKSLEPYKADGRANLIEEVNQVRDYRNWVAHGRQGETIATVTPRMTYERLARLLAVVVPVADTPAQPESAPPPLGGPDQV